MAQEESESVWLDYQNNLPHDRLVGLIKPQEKLNQWFLMGVLGISYIEVDVVDENTKRYKCFDQRNDLLLSLELSDYLPIDQKVTVIRTAIRMRTNGHHH